MKIKFLTLFLFLASFAKAQILDTTSWSPVGASWVYRVSAQFARPYMKFQYNGDTIIQGIASKKIDCYSFEYLGASGSQLQRTPDQYMDSKFMHQSNDTVYILVRDTFRTLYTFAAQAGDSWQITETGDYSVQNASLPPTDWVTVSSASSRTASGLSFEQLNLAGGSAWRLGFGLLKNLGDLETFLPALIPPNNEEIVCNTISLMAGLECYSDSQRGMLAFATTPGYTCEQIMSYQPTDTTGISTISANFSVHCYPNPANNQINLSIQHQTEAQEHHLRIYNSVGQPVMWQKITNQQTVDISRLPAGAYLLLLENPYFSKTWKISKQ